MELHKLGPLERLNRLAEQLESGDIPSNGELVATIRSIGRQFEHVEAMFLRHAVMPGLHHRDDGTPCGYLADKFCNKCGWFKEG